MNLLVMLPNSMFLFCLLAHLAASSAQRALVTFYDVRAMGAICWMSDSMLSPLGECAI